MPRMSKKRASGISKLISRCASLLLKVSSIDPDQKLDGVLVLLTIKDGFI